MVLDLIETAFDIEDRSCFVRFLAALHRFKRDSSIHPERERFAEVGVIDLADVDGLLLEVGKLIEHLERIERKVEAPGKTIEVPVGENTLGRMFNVLGDPIDGGEAVPATEPHKSIYRKKAA
mgnify:CR=1 FL=1